jgi:phage gp29-like protein
MPGTKAPNLIEYAGIKGGKDWTRGWINTLANYLPTQDPILNLKSGGDLQLYEQVAQDDQVKSCLQQRFRAVTAKDWEVTPGGDKRLDKQAAEHLSMQLSQIKWDDCNEKMLWGVLYGFSAAEMLWGRQDEKVIIADIRVRDRRRFHFDTDQKLRLKTFNDPLGEALPECKFWHFSVGADHDDEPYGRGLGHWLYWPTFFKRNGIRWWMRFLELFASPARKGTYPAGTTEQQKNVLWDALGNFGQDDRFMIPEGLVIEFLESARNGTVDYKSLCDQMDASIAKIILSQTMTTDNGSSRSQAEVHENVADSVIESDADLLCESFNNGPARWLTDWNYPGAAYPKVRRKLEAAPDLGVLADTDTKLQGLGISLKPEAIAARYGEDYLIPENDESIPQLNSEQVNALVLIVISATQNGWKPELVAGLINGAFPNWPDEAVSAITKNLGDSASGEGQVPDPNTPTPSPDPNIPAPPAQSLDDVAAQFADGDIEGTYEFKMKEGTTKEKNGVTYVLTNSRWKRAEPKPKGKGKTKLSDKSKAAVADVKAKSGVKSKKSLSKVITDEVAAKPMSEDKKLDPSGLVLVPRKPEKETQKEEPKVKKTILEQINDKYSSENPTDDDAKSWLADTIEARNNPTPENVESRTAQELSRQSRRYESGTDTDKFSSKVVDRKSYALATYASEQWDKKKNPDLQKARTNEDRWFNSLMARGDSLKRSDIPNLEKKIATTKSEAVKKTAIKQLTSLKEDIQREPEVREQARQKAAEWNSIYNSSKSDRIKQLEKNFDAESAKTKTSMEATYADIKAGKKSAMETATNDAANIGGVDRQPSKKPGVYRPVSTEDIKDRLRELGSAKSEELFNVGKKTTKADIRQQYRALAGIHHPDKGGSPEKFRSLNDAYNKIMEKLN